MKHSAYKNTISFCVFQLIRACMISLSSKARYATFLTFFVDTYYLQSSTCTRLEAAAIRLASLSLNFVIALFANDVSLVFFSAASSLLIDYFDVFRWFISMKGGKGKFCTRFTII